jgi:hypothetical protein
MLEIKNAIISAAEDIHKRELGENQDTISNIRGLKSNNIKVSRSTSTTSDTIKSTRNNNNKPLIHIFSGHDTVIAPVLTALGIYQHSSYCNWPKYASRIAFEVWTPIGKNIKKYPINRDNIFNLKLSNVHIRVVYNGDDVTQHITACAKKNVKLGKQSKSILCPIDLFVEQIDNNLAPYNSLEEACRL